jgi:hypothetical protein
VRILQQKEKEKNESFRKRMKGKEMRKKSNKEESSIRKKMKK